jgi:hypothetical protein
MLHLESQILEPIKAVIRHLTYTDPAEDISCGLMNTGFDVISVKQATLDGCTCHHSMVRLRVADGRDGHQRRREAANVLNKQPRTDIKGWSSSSGVGRGANNHSPYKIS